LPFRCLIITFVGNIYFLIICYHPKTIQVGAAIKIHNMRKIIVFLLVGSLFSLTSCLDFLEEFYLNKDGSGKYIMTIDMSELFNNPFMKSALEEQAKKDGAEDIPLEQDSVMYYRDMFQEGMLSSTEQNLIKDLSLHMVMSEEKGTFYIKTEIPFSSFEEYRQINNVLAKLKTDDTDKSEDNLLAEMLGGANPMGDKPRFKLEKRKLIRLPVDNSAIDQADDEMMSYMEMLLGEASYKTIYHLPGRVKKTTIPNAVVDGKTVTVENKFIDLIKQNAKIDGYIKYKRR